jgi:hypothetical protein
MVGFWGFEAILVLVALGSSGSTDLVSMVDGPAYFKSRGIEVKADKMLELAGKTPTGGKEVVAQLLAIRWLGEHPAAAKKLANGRDLLTQIAEGKKGKDARGFASDYARMALARINGKSVTLQTLQRNSVRADALQWFPKQSTLFGSFDFRPPKGAIGAEDPGEGLRKMIAKEMRPRGREEMYSFVDRVGNIRVNRVSFAVVPDMNQDAETKVFIRLTGRGDRKRLVDFLAKEMRAVQVKEKKGPGGEAITILDVKGREPFLAIVGNNDLLVCGFPSAQGKNDVVLDEALQVRAGKQTSIVKGPFAGALRNSAPMANGLVIGDLPERWRKEITSGRRSPFKGFPQHVHIILTRQATGVRVRFTGSAENAKDAKAFADSVLELKRQGLEGLKKAPDVLKPKAVEAFKTALKSIKMEARDTLLTGSATISNEAVKATTETVPLLFLRSSSKRPRPVER